MDHPPITSTPTTATPTPQERMALAREAQKRQRAVDEEYRRINEWVSAEGWIIQPATGFTGGAKNIGWELIPPPNTRAARYFATREQAMAQYEKLRLQ